MLDQVDDLLQDQVFLRGAKPGCKCLRNKVADILVNPIPVTRSDMGARGLQSDIFRHIASRCPENPIQDRSEVYDVTHHTLYILLAGMIETTKPVADASR